MFTPITRIDKRLSRLKWPGEFCTLHDTTAMNNCVVFVFANKEDRDAYPEKLVPMTMLSYELIDDLEDDDQRLMDLAIETLEMLKAED